MATVRSTISPDRLKVWVNTGVWYRSACGVDRLAVLVRHLEAWEKMVSVASLDPNLRTEEDLDAH